MENLADFALASESHIEDEDDGLVFEPITASDRVTQGAELLYAPAESVFGAVGPAMAALGWSVYPQEREAKRKPGTVRGQTIAFKSDHELHLRVPSPEELQDWVMSCPTLNAAAVLGAGSRHTFAIDIDCLDASVSKAVQALADKILGVTPFRREGMAPKMALIYRHPENDGLLYTQRHFQPVASGKPNSIEILCGGRPLTLVGIHHKTGNYFKWLKANPVMCGPEMAPLVTSAQVEKFLAAVEEKFPLVAASKSRAAGVGGGTWGPAADAVLVPKVFDQQKIAAGRELRLLSFSASLVKANGAAVMAANEDGSIRQFTHHLAGVCAFEFAKFAVTDDGKWTPERLRMESYLKVSSAVRKVVNGDFAPTLTEEPRRELPLPTPEYTLSDMPQGDDICVVMVGPGESWGSDRASVYVTKADGSQTDYAIGSVRIEMDHVAIAAAREADEVARAVIRAERRAAKALADEAWEKEHEEEKAKRAALRVIEATPRTNKPVIRIEKGQTLQMIQAAERELIDAKLGYYQRNDQVVEVVREVKMTAHGLVTGLKIITHEALFMKTAFESVVGFEKFDGRSGHYKAEDCPKDFGPTYLALAGHWELPRLSGFCSAPTLRLDGSIVEAEGYDEKTEMVLDFGGVEFAAVPEDPTLEDAKAAMATLKSPLRLFPFVKPVHRSVALSMMLCAPVRASMGNIPLHAFDATAPGSGKSKLANMASIMATGRVAAQVDEGTDHIEFQKRMAAELLEGAPVISIDNCERPLGGSFFCSLLTEEFCKIRGFGGLKSSTVQSNSMIIANGNNLPFKTDMDRRVLLCKLDPGVEKPHLLAFDFEPVVETKRRRPEMVIAALTVLRAYKLAGRPCKRAELQNFEDWSSWVREALIWCGEPDPLATQDEARAADVTLDAATSVMTQWHLAAPGKRLNVRELIDLACAQPPANEIYATKKFLSPDFREALLAVAGDGGAVNSRRLGIWIAQRCGRIVNGFQITKLPLISGMQTYRIDVNKH